MINLKLYRNLCFAVLASAFSTQSYGQQDNKADDPNLVANNAVRTDIVKVSGITVATQILPGVNAQTMVSYMDGLARPLQRISVQGSPLHKDIVQFMAYDQYGNQPLQYLPYTAATTNGALQANPITAQNAFYQVTTQQIATDATPFAGTVYDNSPLQRVSEIGAPGAAWQTGTAHSVKTASRLNTAADNIRIWNSTGPTAAYYGIGQLSVSDVTDENGNHVLTFTNKLGQLVSKKVQAGASTWLETIMIYDDLGNVLYQVSPEGVKRIYGASPPAFDATFINTWATSYTYDLKGRMVAKQAPGAGPVYMIYDSNNRLAFTQDARLRAAYATDTWYYCKYDAANRTIMSGLYRYSTPPGGTGSNNQQILQSYLDGLTYDNITTFAYEKRLAGTTYGFSNQCFPTTIADADVLAVNYYDDYDFNNDGTADYQYSNPGAPYAATNAADNSGLVTGTMTRVINPAGNAGGWIKQAVFYDQFGNAIQKQTNNLVNQNALDITSNAVDIYGGHITQTKQVKSLNVTTTVINKMSFDIMDRLTQVAVNINAGADQVVAQYEYNELGQLKDKKLGLITSGANAGTYLQTVDFRYNIRGWLTSINNSTLTADGGLTNGENTDLFGMTILYNQADATGLSNTPKYNGKISEIKWKVNDLYSSSTNPVRERSYVYTYDGADRLMGAQYVANSGSAWNAEINGYNETVGGYDNNGNILSLTRNTFASGASAFTLMDNLSYTYKNSNASNQLASVADLSGNAMGYNGTVNSATQYSYDTNGNLTGDVNKGETITYNDLNKVSKVVTATGSIEYTYDASGTRIRKILYNASHAAINTYDYLDGFVYTAAGAGASTLTYFSTAEGRVTANSTATIFTYEYFITDNLGNTRVSFHDNGSGVAAISQENEYYPFGTTMQGIVVRTAQPNPGNKQLFNGGSELQDDLGFENSYSTPWREYDPQIGRFNAIDPMVDTYAGWTPYNFAFNDPVGMNDPSGAVPPQDQSQLINRLIQESLDRQNAGWVQNSGNNYGYNLNVDLAQGKALFNAMTAFRINPPSAAETDWFLFLSTPGSFQNPVIADMARDARSWSITSRSIAVMSEAARAALDPYSESWYKDAQGHPLQVNGTSAIIQTPNYSVTPDGQGGGGSQQSSPDNSSFWPHLVGPSLIALGQPIKYLKPIGALGSKPGSSVASYTLSKALPQRFTKVLGREAGEAVVDVVGTNVIGRALGRLVPWAGWALTAYDIFDNREFLYNGTKAFVNDMQKENEAHKYDLMWHVH